jgi:hypothetical protein
MITAAALSLYIVEAPVWGKPISSMSCLIPTRYWAALEVALYSASAVDSERVFSKCAVSKFENKRKKSKG